MSRDYWNHFQVSGRGAVKVQEDFILAKIKDSRAILPWRRHPHTLPNYGCVRRYYSQTLPPAGSKDAAVLDICSRWGP